MFRPVAGVNTRASTLETEAVFLFYAASRFSLCITIVLENTTQPHKSNSIPDVLLNQSRLQWILQFQNSFLWDRELHSVLSISPDRLIRSAHRRMSLAADNSFPLEGVILSGASGQATDNNMATQSSISGSRSPGSSPRGTDSPLWSGFKQQAYLK